MNDTELAISATTTAGLDWIGADRSAREAYWLKTHRDPALARWLADIEPTHLYFGSEFCEHLLPSPRALRSALDRAAREDLRFALLTPVASPDVVRCLQHEFLPLLPEGVEVIVNDWGVAALLRDFPALRPVAGRILCRMIKDPRLNNPEWAHRCGTALDSEAQQAVFSRVGFTRLEIDVPLFADAHSFAGLPLPNGVHLPYACVAKGRMCRPGSMAIAGRERFAVGRRCRKQCLSLAATITRPGFDDGCESVHVGNTLFSRHSPKMLDTVRESARAGLIERLVVAGEAL